MASWICFLFVLLYMWRIRVRQKVNLRELYCVFVSKDIILKLYLLCHFSFVNYSPQIFLLRKQHYSAAQKMPVPSGTGTAAKSVSFLIFFVPFFPYANYLRGSDQKPCGKIPGLLSQPLFQFSQLDPLYRFNFFRICGNLPAVFSQKHMIILVFKQFFRLEESFYFFNSRFG